MSLLFEKKGLLPEIDFFTLSSGFTFKIGFYYMNQFPVTHERIFMENMFSLDQIVIFTFSWITYFTKFNFHSQNQNFTLKIHFYYTQYSFPVADSILWKKRGISTRGNIGFH